MSVKYDFYETPQPKSNKRQPRFHARVVGSETVSTREIANQIAGRCSVTTSDVIAVLDALRYVAVLEMGRGNQIHLEGFGYFKPTLTCPPVKSTKEIRAESISFKSVAFRPEISLKKELRHITIEKTQEKNHSRKLSNEQILELLERYFKDHPYITCLNFRRLCGFTASTADRRLKALVAEGKLKRTGHPRLRMYVLPQAENSEE